MITSPVRGVERQDSEESERRERASSERERNKRGRVKKKKTNKNIGLVVRDYYTFCRTWYVPWKARDDGEWYLARGVLGRVR